MKDRYRLFTLVLYKESESYVFSDVIKNIKGYRYYVYIKHDKDLTSEGLEKKVHYHFIIKLDNACTINALSKKLGVPSNYIQNIRNERSMVRYLIHFDDEDKFQYNFEDLHMSRSYERFVSKCFDDKETEEEILQHIIDFIRTLSNMPKERALFELIQFVNKNCYDTIYKRYRYELKEILTLNL